MKTAEEWSNDDRIEEAINMMYGDDASEGVAHLTKVIKEIQLDVINTCRDLVNKGSITRLAHAHELDKLANSLLK